MIIVNLFRLSFVKKTYMMKLARVLLALALFVATTGVTVTSFACAKKSGTSSPACMRCVKLGRLAHKSCCVYTAKRLSVKSEFSKPVQPKSIVPMMLFAMHFQPAFSIGAGFGSYQLLSYTAPPRTSVEECAQISTFRI